MGIRIHKVMGYGLTDVGEGEFTDPITKDSRFTRDPMDIINEAYEEKNELTIKRFVAWCKRYNMMGEDEIETKLIEHILKNSEEYTKNHYMGEYLFYDDEFTNGKTFLIVPPGHLAEWFRYDNSLDHYEAALSPNMDEKVIEIDGGIFPYNGVYINIRTGDRLKNYDPYSYKVLRDAFAKAVKEGKNKYFPEEDAKDLGYRSPQDFIDNVKLLVPNEIIKVCEFLNIFKDPQTALSLKPIIWTYWS